MKKKKNYKNSYPQKDKKIKETIFAKMFSKSQNVRKQWKQIFAILTTKISHIHSIRKFKWEKLRFLRDLKGQKVHKRDRKRQVHIHSALRLRSKYKAKRGGGSAQRGNQGTQPVSVVHKSSTLDPTCLHPPAHPRRSPPVLWLFLGPVARTSARRQAEI